MEKSVRLTLAAVLSFAVVLLLQDAASAITAPAAGTFAYDVYDIVVDKMLKGPIGFVAGVIAMIVGAIAAIRAEFMLAIPAIVGGAILLKADSLVTSLGCII